MAARTDLRHVVSDCAAGDGGRRLEAGAQADRRRAAARTARCRGDRLRRAWPRRARRWPAAPVDLVTTALLLPDGDGLALARSVREAAGQAYVPVIVVSGDAQSRLESRALHRGRHRLFRQGAGPRRAGRLHPRLRAAGSRSRARACSTSRTAGWWRLATKRMLEQQRHAGAALDRASRTRSRTCETSPRRRTTMSAPTSCSPTSTSRASSAGATCSSQIRGALRLRQAPPAGAGDDRRRQPATTRRAAARRRQRPGAQADRGAPAGDQGAVPAARWRACRELARRSARMRR